MNYTGIHNIDKNNLKLIIAFPAMVILGAALAFYADSPFLIIPFFGALAITSFAALDLALYILIGFLPFSFRFIISPGTEMQIPTEPLLAIMSITLILRWIILKRKGESQRFPFRYPLMFYAISLCLSIINAQNRYAAGKGTIRAIAYMMLAFVIFNVITNRERLKIFFIIGIIPATVAVGWTLIFLIDRISIWRWTSAYEGLPFTSYSHYGSFSAVILLIIIARAIFDRGNYDRVIWTFLLVFYCIALLFCFSRGVWLSFIIAMGLMLLQRSEGIQNKRILIFIGGALFFVLLLSIPQFSEIIVSRITTIFKLGYGSNRERLLRWGTAIMMFLRSPILGNGYGSFAFSYINNPELLGATSRFQMGAHNEYLQLLAETGILGFSAWIWIIISFFVYGFRLLKKLRTRNNDIDNSSFWQSIVIGVMAGELSLLIHFIVNNLIQADIVGIPFWTLIGILPAVGNIIESESSNNGDVL